ncbi:MAG: hypothetical protein OHK0057_18010 [Thermoflexibacter sp.]
MLFVDFIIIMTLFWLTIPAVCGYYAYSRGRSFWFWFAMGTFLPIISHVILLFLPNQTNEFEKELEEIRLQYGIAGIKSDKTNNAQINKLLKKPRQRIHFEIKELRQKKVVEIFINGVNLKHIIHEAEKTDANIYEGIPLFLFRTTSLHLLGEPEAGYGDNEKRAALLICKSDTYFRSALMAKIEIHRKYIVWHSFQRNQKPDDRYHSLAFAFNKIQYMNALDEIQQKIEVA